MRLSPTPEQMQYLTYLGVDPGVSQPSSPGATPATNAALVPSPTLAPVAAHAPASISAPTPASSSGCILAFMVSFALAVLSVIVIVVLK